MKFNKIFLYYVTILNIIVKDRTYVFSLPTNDLVQGENSINSHKSHHSVHSFSHHEVHHESGHGRIMVTKANDINSHKETNNSHEEPDTSNTINESDNDHSKTDHLKDDIDDNSKANNATEILNNNEDILNNDEDEKEDTNEIDNIESNLNKSTSENTIKEFFEKTKNTVIDIYITMPESDYSNMTDIAQCVDYRQARDFSTSNASAQFEFNDEVLYLSQIKLSLGGASSRAFQKVGYNIKTLNDDETIYGIKNIKLRSDDRDPTHMVSRLSADFIKSVGLTAPSSAYARLYINDQYMGLYTLQDVVKKNWIKKYFGDKNTKNCFKCETIGFNFESFETKNTPVTCTNINDDYADYTEPFDQFVKSVNEAQTVEDLEKVMDVEVLLKYIAFEWIVLSWDHMLIYGHNFYWYLRDDGKWIPIYFDFDITWYISNRVNTVNRTLDKKLKEKFPDDDHVFWPNMSLKDWEPGHRIIDILIHQDDTRFRKTVHEMIKTYYNPTYLNKKIDDLHIMLKEYIIEDLMFIKDLQKNFNSESNIPDVVVNSALAPSATTKDSSLPGYQELFSIQNFSNLEDEKLHLLDTGNLNAFKSSSYVVSSALPANEIDNENNMDDLEFILDEDMDDEEEAEKKLMFSSVDGIAGTALEMAQRGRINLYGLNFAWTYQNYYEVINGENYLINTRGGSRSAPLKWTIQKRFNYLCHTYGINPETLELITPRPERREWSSTNAYKLSATYDETNLVRFNYPYLEKEDFMTNYCKYCEIYKEDGNGKMLGFENNETCIIHTVDCGIEKGEEMGPNGFPYCQGCDVYDIKGGVLLGMENNVICEILTDNC